MMANHLEQFEIIRATYPNKNFYDVFMLLRKENPFSFVSFDSDESVKEYNEDEEDSKLTEIEDKESQEESYELEKQKTSETLNSRLKTEVTNTTSNKDLEESSNISNDNNSVKSENMINQILKDRILSQNLADVDPFDPFQNFANCNPQLLNYLLLQTQLANANPMVNANIFQSNSHPLAQRNFELINQFFYLRSRIQQEVLEKQRSKIKI